MSNGNEQLTVLGQQDIQDEQQSKTVVVVREGI
jgi:hypothetical protein